MKIGTGAIYFEVLKVYIFFLSYNMLVIKCMFLSTHTKRQDLNDPERRGKQLKGHSFP